MGNEEIKQNFNQLLSSGNKVKKQKPRKVSILLSQQSINLNFSNEYFSIIISILNLLDLFLKAFKVQFYQQKYE
jgi:hypothetical protein